MKKTAAAKKADVKPAEKAAEKKAPAAKAAAKKTSVKTAETKSAEKKAETKAAEKKAETKTAEKKAESAVILQFAGSEFDIEQIKSRVAEDIRAKGKRVSKNLNIYIKPEEYTVYYVNGKDSDKINL
ncbi:MAG: hypothetical protein IK990_01185 [Ruminiclostridium sp.]|nr:hypothetical protein [Ruminiclostridium sp.]